MAKATELSPTQLRVARLSDHTAEEIAEQLGMAPRTVREHLNVVRTRLGVTHKRFIIRALRERGLMDDE
jgi:DNA-binding CsgD family transcriptional regulator